MTRNSKTGRESIDRRTVLKSAAALSAAGVVGVPAFSGSALGQTTSEFEIYALEHNDHLSSDRPDKLIVISSEDLTDGAISDPIEVDTVDLVDSAGEPTLLNTATLAASPDGHLYGLNRVGSAEVPGSKSESQAFRIEIPADGDTQATVEFVGSSNATLSDIWASAFDSTGSWYGVDSTSSDALYSIDPATGATTKIGDLTLDGEPYDAVHVGMGVNFQTDELWLVSGNKPSGQSDIFNIDKGDASLSLAPDGEDALTSGRLVGGAFGPCSNVLHVARNRNELYGFEVSSGTELAFGSLQYTSGEETVEVGIDNLAVPFGIECRECVSCDLGGTFKYEWVEDEEAQGECKGEFVVYDADDNVVPEPDGLSLVSVTCDEDGEPQEACFETEFCTLSATVKAGRETDTVAVDAEEAGGEFCVTGIDDTNPRGKTVTYAISHIVFACPDDGSEDEEPDA